MFWRDIKDIKVWVDRIDRTTQLLSRDVNELLCMEGQRQEADRREKSDFRKAEEYMKNVEKLNSMVNEFKGCVSMARASLPKKRGKNTE